MKRLLKIFLVNLVSILLVLLLCCLSCLLFLSGKRGSSESSSSSTRTFSRQNNQDFLTSNLGSKPYKCSGSCFCEESNIRKSVSLTRSSIFYLITALSSSLAYQKAKQYYQRECELSNALLNDCSSRSQISSHVDECIPFYEFSDEVITIEPESVSSEEEEQTNEEEEHGPFFSCTGKCLSITPDDGVIGMEMIMESQQKKLPDDEEFRIQWRASAKNMYLENQEICDDLSLSKVYSFDDLRSKYVDQLEDVKDGFTSMYGREDLFWEYSMLANFAAELNKYCLDEGIVVVTNSKIEVCEGWKGFYARKNNIFLKAFNPSIKCVKDNERKKM